MKSVTKPNIHTLVMTPMGTVASINESSGKITK